MEHGISPVPPYLVPLIPRLVPQPPHANSHFSNSSQPLLSTMSDAAPAEVPVAATEVAPQATEEKASARPRSGRTAKDATKAKKPASKATTTTKKPAAKKAAAPKAPAAEHPSWKDIVKVCTIYFGGCNRSYQPSHLGVLCDLPLTLPLSRNALLLTRRMPALVCLVRLSRRYVRRGSFCDGVRPFLTHAPFSSPKTSTSSSRMPATTPTSPVRSPAVLRLASSLFPRVSPAR